MGQQRLGIAKRSSQTRLFDFRRCNKRIGPEHRSNQNVDTRVASTGYEHHLSPICLERSKPVARTLWLLEIKRVDTPGQLKAIKRVSDTMNNNKDLLAFVQSRGWEHAVLNDGLLIKESITGKINHCVLKNYVVSSHCL